MHHVYDICVKIYETQRGDKTIDRSNALCFIYNYNFSKYMLLIF